MLGFRDHGVIISVFAQGCAQMPPAASPAICLFYVEVGLLAELNTVEGYFTVQAALAPASHVLLPSCRLVGGFALVNWFDPSTYSGDFVFTVGGVSDQKLLPMSTNRVVPPSISTTALVSYRTSNRRSVHPCRNHQRLWGRLLCGHAQMRNGRRRRPFWPRNRTCVRMAGCYVRRLRPV